MATKKIIKIGLEASFVNMDKAKQSLESLQKLKLSPLDSVEISKILKSIEQLYSKYPNKKMDIGIDGESKDMQEFIALMEDAARVINNVKFPEWEIDKEIQASEQFKKNQADINKLLQEEAAIKRKLTADENKLSRQAEGVFKERFIKEKGEDYSKEAFALAEEEYYLKQKKALDDVRSSLEKAKNTQNEYVASQKNERKVAEQVAAVEKNKKDGINALGKAYKDTTGAISDFNEKQRENEKIQKQKTLAASLKDVLGYTAAVHLMRSAYRETIQTIRELDKAFTEMAMVSTLTRQEAWGLERQLFSLANQTGATATEVAQLTTYYLQQGRSLKDAIELTEVAAKAAKVAGIATKEAADLLTTAINGFGMAASEAEAVADKFARLAAVSATNFEEMATALSKVASQANMAGMSMDFTLGLLAKGIETTRESPESIGTALKTVIARMQELSDFGKTLEDGMDVNRVETMLGNLGIALRDSNGELRSLEDVITELGHSWETLTKNQKAGIAVALAGTRQQSRLIAMMDDFDRTLELTNEAQESSGTLMAQHSVYVQSLDAALNKLTNAYQAFISSLADNQLLITGVNILRGLLNTITSITNLLGKKTMTVLIGVIFTVNRFNKVSSGIAKAFEDAGESANGFLGTLKVLAKYTGLDKFKNAGKGLAAMFGVTDKSRSFNKDIKAQEKIIKQQDKIIAKEKSLLKDKLEEKNKEIKAKQEEFELTKRALQERQKNQKKGSFKYNKDEERIIAKEKATQKSIDKLKEEQIILEKNSNEVIKNAEATKNAAKTKLDSAKANQQEAKALKASTKEMALNISKAAAMAAAMYVITMAWNKYQDAVKGTVSANAFGEIAEAEEKIKSIKKLTEELDELNNTALKSVDEITRMKDIIDEIYQTSGKKIEIAYDITGEFDMKAMQEKVDEYTKKEEEKNKQKLLKAKSKSQFSAASMAAFGIAGGLGGAAIGATLGSIIGGPAGAALGAKIGGGAGSAIGTTVGGYLNATKEKRWLKSEENQQVLKDLEMMNFKESSLYKELEEQEREVAEARVSALYEMYDMKKGSIEGFEKYSKQISEDIARIEGTESLAVKLQAYNKSENQKQLKTQYALLEFLNNAKNKNELVKLMSDSVLTVAEGEDLLEAINTKLAETISDEKTRNEVTSQKLQEYYKGYEDFLKNFDEASEKYAGLSKSFTGFLQKQIRETSGTDELLQAIYDATANVYSIQQLAQSSKSLISKVSNFNSLMSEMRSGTLDIDKMLDAIENYNLSVEQIRKLAAGTLTQSDVREIIGAQQQEVLDKYNNTLRDTETKLEAVKNQIAKKNYADQKELESLQEKQVALEKEQTTIQETLRLSNMYINTLKVETIAQEELAKEISEVNKLREMGYVGEEVDTTSLDKSYAKSIAERRANIQRLVDLAGAGTITFDEQGMAQLDISKLREDQIIDAQGYYNKIRELQEEGIQQDKDYWQTKLEIENEGFEKQKGVLQERLDAYNEYISEMERLEKESETNKNREDIAAQLARLGTATDAESLKKRKELTQQLEELNKAQIKDEREAGVKGLESEIDSLDKSIAKNTELMAEKIRQSAIDFANTIKEAVGEIYITKYNAPTNEPTNSNEDGTTTTNETRTSVVQGSQFVFNGVNLTLSTDQSEMLMEIFKQVGITMQY